MATDLRDLRMRLKAVETPQKVAPTEDQGVSSLTDFESVRNQLLDIDPDVDQSGVQDFWFRAGLARTDTDDEREHYLTKIVGPEGWTKDKYGKYALTPQGMKKRGLPAGTKPVLIDEPGLSWRDVGEAFADPESLALAVTGGVAGKAATGVMGAVKGMGLTGAGAAAGKWISEVIDELIGIPQEQTEGEVAQMAGEEALYAAGGEGVFRSILKPIGKKLLGPGQSRMTPEGRDLTREAREMGARPSVSQITKGPILGRTQSMMNRIFGDPLARENANALNAEILRIKTATGPAVTGVKDVGEGVAKSIATGRRALAKWSNIVTTKIDEAIESAGLNPKVVPTARLKAEMRTVRDSLPTTRPTVTQTQTPSPLAGLSSVKSPASLAPRPGPPKIKPGKAVFTSNDLLKSIGDGLQLPDRVTISEMQAISQKLFEAIGDDTIVPGITGRNARRLWKASRSTFDDISDPQIKGMVKPFHAKYAEHIQKFDNALIDRIMRNPRLAGKIEPEQIVGTVFRKGAASRVNRLRAAVDPGTWKRFQRASMDEIVGTISQRTDDPLVEVFAGKRFLNTLDSYGRETLEAMFGPEQTKALYRLGRVTQLVTQRQVMSGGLVAAHIALHPLKNLPRLVQLNILSRFLNTPFAVRWLTEGLEAKSARTQGEYMGRVATYFAALADEDTRGAVPEEEPQSEPEVQPQ